MRPTTIRVPADCATLQMAVDFASEGDTIEISAGEYEENVIIKTGLTIRASCSPVEIRSSDETEPIVLVDSECGKVTFEGVAFLGKAGSHSRPQTAIQITCGDVSLRNCLFKGWETPASLADWLAGVGDEDGEACFRPHQGSPAIVVSGSPSALEARDCQFTDSDFGIVVMGGARASIRGCEFRDYGVAVSVERGSITSKRNAVLNGGTLVAVGPEAQVDSQYDSVVGSTLLYCSNGSGSTVTFSHATVDSYHLRSLTIGKSNVHPGPDGRWLWNTTRVIITDSIVCIHSDEPATCSYAPSAGEWGPPQLDAWNGIEFCGSNLLYAPPDFPGPHPRFGRIIGSELSLQPNSPAIGAASDGTNLGAWQGNME